MSKQGLLAPQGTMGSPKRLVQDSDEDDIPPKKHKQDSKGQASSLHGNNIMVVDDIQDSDEDNNSTPSKVNDTNRSSNNPPTYAPVKYVWLTDNKSWEEYPPEFCDLLEREYKGARGEVKVDNQRFVDLHAMVQRRYDDRNKIRPVQRLSPDQGKTATKSSTSKQGSNKAPTQPLKAAPLPKANYGSNIAQKDNQAPKSTSNTNSSQDTKWYWLSETGWVAYEDKISDKLERNFISGKKQNVHIDDTRFVDLKDMFQRRYDQPTRTRVVKRESHAVPPNKQAQNSGAPTKPPATTKPAKAPVSTNANTGGYKGKDSTKTNVQWYWLADDNQWQPYDAATAAALEGEYSAGNKEARVDEERYVDLENMLQRRFDNELKRRYVKRQPVLTEEQKERSERNRLAALEKLKAKGQQSILSFLSAPKLGQTKTENHKTTATEQAKKAIDSDEGDQGVDESDETKELQDRRQQYKCGADYVTLNQIETWEATLLRLNSSKPASQTTYKPDKLLNQKVSLWRGDITSLEIDAIVNAAKPSLLGGGGIDGAIHSAAGKGLVRECMLLDGCDIGGAKITSGHKLPASFVIHTVGPTGEDADALEQCYTSVLELVAQYNIKSVAFCCVSTGIYGYPNDKAAQVGLRTVRKWLDKGGAALLDRIIFCMYLEKDHTIYSTLMQKYFPIHAEGEQDA